MYFSLEALEGLDASEQRHWSLGLTFEEARYLRDELTGALEAGTNAGTNLRAPVEN